MIVLGFFAHPDDETMLCGGSLALLSSLGEEVHLLCATHGEGGENGEPPLCTREELGAYREGELRCASRELGAASLTFFDYVDPTVGPDNQLYAFTSDEEGLANHLVDQIRQVKAQVLFTHGSNGEYGHPAHLLCHRTARRAVELIGRDAPLLYTIQGAFEKHPYPRLMNKDDPAHLVLDVSQVLQAKVNAALCHRTQHALFIRNTSKELDHPVSVPEVILGVESLHRASPPLSNGGLPDDPLARLFLQSGAVRAKDAA